MHISLLEMLKIPWRMIHLVFHAYSKIRSGDKWIEYNRKLIVEGVGTLLNPDKVCSLIDVGCGYGAFFPFLSKFLTKCNLIVGIDLSRVGVLHAKNINNKNNPHLMLIVADAQALPIRTLEFDLVYEKDMLHHANNPFIVLRELVRVSRKYLILIEANRPNPVMLLWTKYGGHQHFSYLQLKSMLEQGDLSVSTHSIHAYPFYHLIGPNKKIMCFFWDLLNLLFKILLNLLPSTVCKVILKILSTVMKKPSFNIFLIQKRGKEGK